MRILLVVLFFCVGMYAAEASAAQNDTEEIGVPFIDFKKGPIESAVLASDGKSFYTLQDIDLIHWNLSPLKKIKTWKLPLEKITVGKKIDRFRDIYFLNNYSKVLLTSINELVIYNLETNQIEKRVACRNHSLVKEGNLLYLARADQKGDRDEEGNLAVEPYLHLEVWSILDLKKIKSMNITKQSDKFTPHLLRYRGESELREFHDASRYQGQLLLGEDVIYYFAITAKVAVIDKKDLKLKKMLWEEVKTHKTADGYLVMNKKIYRQSDASFVFEFPKNDEKGVKEFLNKAERKPVYSLPEVRRFQRNSTLVGDLILRSAPKIYVFTRKHSKENFFARIGQFEGELIIKERSTLTTVDGKYQVIPNHFEVSSRDFKLLKMKTSDGKIVPMNDATFKKYNRQIDMVM